MLLRIANEVMNLVFENIRIYLVITSLISQFLLLNTHSHISFSIFYFSLKLLLNVFGFLLCLEVLREKRVEGSRGKESSGEESRGEWLFFTLFGCF